MSQTISAAMLVAKTEAWRNKYLQKINAWITEQKLIEKVSARADNGHGFLCFPAPDFFTIYDWDTFSEELANTFTDCWFHYQHILIRQHGEEEVDDEDRQFYIIIGWDEDMIEYVHDQEKTELYEDIIQLNSTTIIKFSEEYGMYFQ